MMELLIILRRRKKFVLIPLLLVFAVPSILSFNSLQTYEADAMIWLDSDIVLTPLIKEKQEVDVKPIEKHAQILSQLLASRTFLLDVIENSRLRNEIRTDSDREKTIALLRKNLTAWASGPNTLKIVFNGSSPRQAVSVVKATTNLFMNWTLDAMNAQSSDAASFFKKQLEQYIKQLEASRQAIQTFKEQHPETVWLEQTEMRLFTVNTTVTHQVEPKVQLEFERLQKDHEYAIETYSNALGNFATAQVFRDAERQRYRSGFRVADAAQVSKGLSMKKLILTDGLAFFAAIILSITAIAVAEMKDTTLRQEQEVEEVLGLPVLASVQRWV